MVFGGKTFVVNRWASDRTAGGGYVEDNHGRIWRILDSYESPNNAANTTGGMVRWLMPNGELKP